MDIFSLILGFLFFFVALTIHEFSHAYVADRLGDPTARFQGRLSLNPLRHIDLFGTILLPLMLILSGAGFVFGWAKPVEYDPFNLRNPRKDSGFIALAGPASNFIFAIVMSIVLRLLTLFQLSDFFIIGYIINLLITYNVFLGLFNLIPIHPLDGFNIVAGFLPREKAHEWDGLRRYGTLFLILLIIPLFGSGSMLSAFLTPVVRLVLFLLIPQNGTGGVL